MSRRKPLLHLQEQSDSTIFLLSSFKIDVVIKTPYNVVLRFVKVFMRRLLFLESFCVMSPNRTKEDTCPPKTIFSVNCTARCF